MMDKEVNKIADTDASNYEEYLGPLFFEPAAKTILPHIAGFPASAVLELACGSGRLTKHLREAFPAATTLVATDINPDMLEQAQQKLNDSSIKFQLADAQQLPFADQSFDLIIIQFGLMFLPDQQGGVNEAFRVLKPGGHYVFTTWDRPATMPLIKLLIDDIIVPLFKDEDTSRFYKSSSLHDPALLNHFLAQAGFASRQVIPLKFTGRTDSPQQFVNSYFLKQSLGRQVKEKVPASFNAIVKEMERSIMQQFGAGPFEFELSALAGIGQK